MGDEKMQQIFTSRELGGGARFHAVREPKFQSNRLTVCLVTPLREETASENALVPFLLRKGCRACPDFTELNRKLARLYGAILGADVTKYGGWQILHVSLQALDDRLALDGEEMVKECAELLCSILLEPNFDGDGLFPEKDFELEKQYLIDTIDSEINDKRVYAIGRCTSMLFEGEPYAVKRYGSRARAEALTREAVTAAYRRLMETAVLEVLFTGPGNAQAAEEIFRRHLAAMPGRRPLALEKSPLRAEAAPRKEKEENMDVAQGKLVMGYRMGAPDGRREQNAARMFSALYGGTPFSKLFLNVREKLSLCYYCVSRFDRPTGVLLVDSGVEPANREKAQEEIESQLRQVAEGKFTDEDLQHTLLIIRNSLQSVGDMLDSIEGWYLTRVLEGAVYTPEEDALAMGEITREDVIAAAQKAQLEAVYFLRGQEQDGEEAEADE